MRLAWTKGCFQRNERKNLLYRVRKWQESGPKGRICHPLLSVQDFLQMFYLPLTLWQVDGETVETVAAFFFFWAPKSLQMVTAAMKLKDAYSLEGKL